MKKTRWLTAASKGTDIPWSKSQREISKELTELGMSAIRFRKQRDRLVLEFSVPLPSVTVRREAHPGDILVHPGDLPTPIGRSLFPLSQLGTSSAKPSSRYPPPRFCLSTRSRWFHRRTEKALLSEPIVYSS